MDLCISETHPSTAKKSCQWGEIFFCHVSYKGRSGVNSIHKITAVIFQLAERLHRSKNTVASKWFLIGTVLAFFFYSQHVVWSLPETISAAIDRRTRNHPWWFPSFPYRLVIRFGGWPWARLKAGFVRAALMFSLFSFSAALTSGTFSTTDLVPPARDIA